MSMRYCDTEWIFKIRVLKYILSDKGIEDARHDATL